MKEGVENVEFARWRQSRVCVPHGALHRRAVGLVSLLHYYVWHIVATRSGFYSKCIKAFGPQEEFTALSGTLELDLSVRLAAGKDREGRARKGQRGREMRDYCLDPPVGQQLVVVHSKLYTEATSAVYNCLVRPHRMHSVHRCSLLLPM